MAASLALMPAGTAAASAGAGPAWDLPQPEAALGEADQVLEELVALQLHLNHSALLLLRELAQVHHREAELIILKVDALGT